MLHLVPDAPRMKRSSLLKRNPDLTRSGFSAYYEHNHGPLAANQAGFRKFSTRYLQNHVEDLPDGSEPLFDGVTMTTQLPREDYAKGFFTEPDYENVKDDEIYLFDLDHTVSLLGEEILVLDGPQTLFKALILTTRERFDARDYRGLARLVLNKLDVSTASALGFRAGRFNNDLLAETWFDSLAARQAAFETLKRVGPEGAFILPVREVLIFGPEKPWPQI